VAFSYGWFLKKPGIVSGARTTEERRRSVYFLDCDFLGRRVAWMFGRTPPPAMATEPRSLFSSSSLRTVS